MKHFSDFDNIFETEAWYVWGNVEVILGHLDWGLGTKGPQSDSAVKNYLGLHIVSNVVKPFVKNGLKTFVAGSCTMVF